MLTALIKVLFLSNSSKICYDLNMIIKLEEMKKMGLNLMASIEVSKLPKAITDAFSRQKILFDQNDTLTIIGSGGNELWKNLPRPINQMIHPFDNFSINYMMKLDGDARILFPKKEWAIPLQSLGRLLNLARPSLLGLDINQQYGVWFAYRGAFLSRLKLNTAVLENFESPCLTCLDKPCIKACPVGAVDSHLQFNSKICSKHRLGAQSNCFLQCDARLACPYQKKHQYSKEQITYHMTNVHSQKMLSDYLDH